MNPTSPRRVLTHAAVAAMLLRGIAATCGHAQPPDTVLENAGLRAALDPTGGTVTLTDKRTGVSWTFGPAEVVTEVGTVVARQSGGVRQAGPELRFRAAGAGEFTLRLLADPPALEFAAKPAAGAKRVRLLKDALPVAADEGGSYAAAYRMGILLRAEGDAAFHRRWRDENSMAMLGAVKHGSALLATWDDPFTEVQVDYGAGSVRRMTMGLSMRGAARSVRLRPLGRGGYVEVAKAYRAVARERGLLKTLAEKARDNPRVAELFGAADFPAYPLPTGGVGARWNCSDRWRPS
jgi:hypothetical protein